jgi:hypothetical protein
MRFRGNRSSPPARREARSIEELVGQIAEDKSRPRFRPAEPVVERPREVFLDAVRQLAMPLKELGFAYARSGPHASLRRGPVLAKVSFGSSHLNIPGELVNLHMGVGIHDRALGAWRKEQGQPRRTDDVVSTKHLGHLLRPPVWLEWNLANPKQRAATIADAATSLRHHGLPFLERITRLLSAVPPDAGQLAGLVDDEALVEYYVRSRKLGQAAHVVESILGKYHERGRSHFEARVSKFRSEGLPVHQTPGVPDGLAFLVVRYDLPVRIA